MLHSFWFKVHRHMLNISIHIGILQYMWERYCIQKVGVALKSESSVFLMSFVARLQEVDSRFLKLQLPELVSHCNIVWEFSGCNFICQEILIFYPSHGLESRVSGLYS
jgi:hypothetical protein